MYNKQIINSTNKIKSVWNIIRSETKRGKTHTVSKHHNSPDTYNDYFLSIAEQITQKIKSTDIDDSNDNNLTYYLSRISKIPFPNIIFQHTTTREIERIINSLRNKKSFGYDEITTKMLQISAPFISSPLSYIFNKCIIKGIFPTRLKYSIVKPILKNGDKTNVANF
jgi:hypothetical protein